MKTAIISLWYPSHGYNLGIVSKSLRNTISSIAEGIEVKIIETYFEDQERFNVKCKYNSDENLQYLTKTLYRLFGKIQVLDELKVGDVTVGRLVNPGTVGFGIFVDIGIRPHKDVLFNLINLRNTLVNNNKISTRKLVVSHGFIDSLTIELEIKSINGTNKNIIVDLTKNYFNILLEWKKSSLQKLIITKYLNYNIEKQIKQLNINKFIKEVTLIDPLTTIITCKKRTNANGLLPILGPKIGSSPMGIFNPEKIEQLL